MSFDFLAGSWIYRSFRNLPEVLPRIDPEQPIRDDLAKWSRYLFGQGEMVLRPSFNGSIAGAFVMRPGMELDLAGKAERSGERVLLNWNGIGRAGRESDGWMYEYRGELMPNWIDGRGQTDAIVGTVIRTVPHDDLAPLATTDRISAPGSVVSFIMVRKRFRTANEVIALPGPVLQRMGSVHHRVHHLVWHFLRNDWGKLKDIQRQQITQMGWAPPRPRQQPVRGNVVERERDNGAGEDFLYMHRRMLIELRKILADNNLPPIGSWTEIPKPNRSSDNADGFAVPPTWTRPKEVETKAIGLVKSDEYFNSRMNFLERKFKDPAYLKTLTLDQLGTRLEMQIHNQLHMRWSSLPLDPANLQPLPEGRDRYDVSDKWSTPFTGPDGKAAFYDDLLDEFASHVHPVFWRLHGWVDDRIEDWAKAHGANVVRKDVDEVPWFDVGTWVKVREPWVYGTNHHSMKDVLQVMSGRQGPGPHPHHAAILAPSLAVRN